MDLMAVLPSLSSTCVRAVYLSLLLYEKEGVLVAVLPDGHNMSLLCFTTSVLPSPSSEQAYRVAYFYKNLSTCVCCSLSNLDGVSLFKSMNSF